RVRPRLESEYRFVEMGTLQVRIDDGERRDAIRARTKPLHERSLNDRRRRVRPGAVDVRGRRGRIAIREVAERQAMPVAAVVAEAGGLPRIGQAAGKAGARQQIAPGD